LCCSLCRVLQLDVLFSRPYRSSLSLSFCLYRLRRPRSSTLFPYTTLFRSHSFYSKPFVDGTPFTRELLRLAASNARPKALKIARDRKSTRLNSSHVSISYAVFCLKKNKQM